MVNVGRVCNSNRQEEVLSTDAEVYQDYWFTGLRGRAPISHGFFLHPQFGQTNNKNAFGLRSKLKLKLYPLACVLIVAKHDAYM